MKVEGGRVFANAESIVKENIYYTITAFIDSLKRVYPNAPFQYKDFFLLGSGLKKDISKDIDLGIDVKILQIDQLNLYNISDEKYQVEFNLLKRRARTSTDEQLKLKAFLKLFGSKAQKEEDFISFDVKKTTTGQAHFMFPQYQSVLRSSKQVQIDLMVGNPEWLKFSYYSESYEGNIKGLHRTQFILHLLSYKGYSFNHTLGVMKKESRKVVAKNPEEVCNLLNMLYGIKMFQLSNIYNYTLLFKTFINQSNPLDAEGVFDIYLKTLDSTRCDIPDTLQSYWVEHKQRLKLKGKFLPSDSRLQEFLKE